MTLSDEPLYNLKTVINTTGLPASTLRAWERRYGLPRPARSSGGQRLYSDRDLKQLRWLLARLEEGARIRQAVDQLQSLQAAGHDPLIDPTEPFPKTMEAAPGIDALRDEWLRACLAFDEPAAVDTLDRALALFPIEQVVVRLLQAGLNRIGTDWYEGRVSIQQEHFTSALAMRRLESLFAAIPPATRPQTVLVGCPAGEWHTFAPLLLVLFLRRRGLHVLYLGADLPARQLVETVQDVKPDLVILSAQTLTGAASLLPAARHLRQENHPMAYGGWIFTQLPGLRERFPAHYLGDDLERAALSADHLAENPLPAPSAPPPEETLQAALAEFRLRRGQIETSLLEDKELASFERRRLWETNLFLGNDLEAALVLGNVAFLELDLRWIRNLLFPQAASTRLLNTYLRAYQRALNLHLGEKGRLITDWNGWEERT